MNIGDKVIVVYTPYWSVRNGTSATVVDIKFPESKWMLYILDTKPCSSFREHEIKLVEKTHAQ